MQKMRYSPEEEQLLMSQLWSPAIKDDPEAVQKYGVDFATRQCAQLLQQGAPGIHFYTLNRSGSTRRIVENLKKMRLLD